MKEFLQAVLITFALTFPVFWMSNGFSLTPKTTATPNMDMSEMSGMDHATNEEEMPEEMMDTTMPGMNH